jgi:hypothetical protein
MNRSIGDIVAELEERGGCRECMLLNVSANDPAATLIAEANGYVLHSKTTGIYWKPCAEHKKGPAS